MLDLGKNLEQRSSFASYRARRSVMIVVEEKKIGLARGQ